MAEARTFPVLNGGAVPWEVIEPHRSQAAVNHGQSLETLARRGGLSWCELLAVLEDRPWRRMDEVRAHELVREKWLG